MLFMGEISYLLGLFTVVLLACAQRQAYHDSNIVLLISIIGHHRIVSKRRRKSVPKLIKVVAYRAHIAGRVEHGIHNYVALEGAQSRSEHKRFGQKRLSYLNSLLQLL